MSERTERLLKDSTELFLGKTIAKIDAHACNNIEFLFTDGTRVALHIDCDSHYLPVVQTCTHCVEIAA